MARTRTALIEAFNALVMRGRPKRIRVADIIAEARVGRSTFYDHYAGADAIHLDALARPFAPLADAAAGRGDVARMTHLLAHFWQNRQRARESLAGPLGAKAARLLADMVEARLREQGAALIIPPPLAALQLAEAALAPIRGWVAGRAPSMPDALALAVCRSGAQLVAALAAPAGGGDDAA